MSVDMKRHAHYTYLHYEITYIRTENEMKLTPEMFLIVCPLVFMGSLVDSIAGGGGLITLPAYLLAGLPTHFAIGTNKLSSSIGTTVSAARFCKNKLVDWGLAVPSILLALAGSSIGANLALLLNDKIMQHILIFVLPVVAFYVLKEKSLKESSDHYDLPRKKVTLIVCLASLLIGAYDGFYGPGTGTFLILIYTGLAKMNVKIASGNTKLVNLASNIAALVTFLFNGKIIFLLGITAAVFSIAGSYVGSGLAIKNGHKIIRPIILFVLAMLLLKIII